jgi:predicted nuclease of predicted toxin-antitoxin system
MKFKIDESLPSEAATLLRESGHEAMTVHDQAMVGASDKDLAAVCRTEARILVTLDLDFGNIQAFPPDVHCGIIVLRLGRQDKSTVLEALRAIVPLLRRENPHGKLWVVEPERVRIRG